MKTFQIIWRGAVRSFAYTSVIALVVYTMMAIADPTRNAITAVQYLLLMLFGFICGYAHELFYLRKLPLPARIGVHYGTLLISFIITFAVSGKIEVNATNIIIFALLFTLFYAVSVTATLLILRAMGIYAEKLSCTNNEKKKETTYTNRFN